MAKIDLGERIRILQTDIWESFQISIEVGDDRLQFSVQSGPEGDHVCLISRLERLEPLRTNIKIWIKAGVSGVKRPRFVSSFKEGVTIRQTENDNRNFVIFASGALNQPQQLSGVIFMKMKS